LSAYRTFGTCSQMAALSELKVDFISLFVGPLPREFTTKAD
jgi:hypothetical protein